MDLSVFVVLRALHILVAALWVGAGIFLTAFLMPVMRRLGPHGAPVMAAMAQRRMGPFMAAIGALTVLSGLWLYWIYTRGLDAGIALSAPGIMLGLGGLAGILAAILGGAVIGRSVERIRQLGTQLRDMPDGAPKLAQQDALVRLHRRAALASKCDATLLVVALLLMALGHYA